MGVMTVAGTVKWRNGLWVQNDGYEYPLVLVAAAAVLVLTGPGRWSADHDRGAAPESSREQLALAIWCLRVFAGVALIVVAFREKLAYPDYAVDFLRHNSDLELSKQLGLGWSTETFVRVAGAVEVLFGLLLISGAMPHAIVLIAGIPFNATLYFFGEAELFGHLPIYGAMLVLLVYGSHAETRPLVKRLLPARLAPAAPS